MREPIRSPSVEVTDARVADLIDTIRYAPRLPADAPLDEYGLPIVDPHPDEDPDERL